ncbi:hypothetical protein PN498_11570 [Oscillatoria sp. CS-180]|uniref:hypothetical protein n=1 Tax=Oscillatoria sp. CS-180 TaxID=3021720 RepID=UPI00232CF1D6|nr:hypothetical protein [Oscillatoria sp. CS-180]MDB9526632.1 hypothetical protein [Oscillatoria sp. CS-180]
MSRCAYADRSLSCPHETNDGYDERVLELRYKKKSDRRQRSLYTHLENTLIRVDGETLKHSLTSV